MSNRYQIYGLQVESTEPLKGVLPGAGDAAPDMRIEWRHDLPDQMLSIAWSPFVTPQFKDGDLVSMWVSTAGTQELIRLRYIINGVSCDFIFDRGGLEVWVVYPEQIPRGLIVSYLLGSVMSSILRMRGTLCLHAGVVSFNGRAIALAGRKGAGKSTISSALAKAGGLILSDDIAAIRSEREGFLVFPGDTRPRLFDESVNKIFGEANNIRKASSPIDKVRVNLNTETLSSGANYPRAAGLSCLFTLEAGSDSEPDVEITMVKPGDRFMALFQHVYGFCLDTDSTHSNEFRLLSRLADRVPVYRVKRPNNLDKLESVRDAILEQFFSLNPVSVSI